MIVVLSDTHAADVAELPARILDEVTRADLIIHAGDYTSKQVLDQLREGGNFKGVYGNMDPPKVRRELPDKAVFELMGFRIGVIHPAEGGSPFDLPERVKTALGTDLDLIIYGHSHQPAHEKAGNTIYFNPGSATGTFPARHKTYGILYIDDTVEGAIMTI